MAKALGAARSRLPRIITPALASTLVLPIESMRAEICTTPPFAMALRKKMIATIRKVQQPLRNSGISPLIQRQIVIRHRQDHRVNGRAIDRPDAAPAIPPRLPVNHVALLPRGSQQHRL